MTPEEKRRKAAIRTNKFATGGLAPRGDVPIKSNHSWRMSANHYKFPAETTKTGPVEGMNIRRSVDEVPDAGRRIRFLDHLGIVIDGVFEGVNPSGHWLLATHRDSETRRPWPIAGIQWWVYPRDPEASR